MEGGHLSSQPEKFLHNISFYWVALFKSINDVWSVYHFDVESILAITLLLVICLASA